MSKKQTLQEKAQKKGLQLTVYKNRGSLRFCLYKGEEFIHGCRLTTQLEKFLKSYEPPEEEPKLKGIQLNLFDNPNNQQE